jgi:hypothetical protein
MQLQLPQVFTFANQLWLRRAALCAATAAIVGLGGVTQAHAQLSNSDTNRVITLPVTTIMADPPNQPARYPNSDGSIPLKGNDWKTGQTIYYNDRDYTVERTGVGKYSMREIPEFNGPSIGPMSKQDEEAGKKGWEDYQETQKSWAHFLNHDHEPHTEVEMDTNSAVETEPVIQVFPR